MLLQGVLPISPTPTSTFSFATLSEIAPVLSGFGWLLVVFLLMWVVWNTYLLLKRIDYFSAIEWVFLEISIPPDSEETPKSMESFFEIMGGIHKSPDLIEKYFDGYIEAWISCEILCLPGQARYFIIAPAAYRQLVEASIYAQYPRAEVVEAEDYTQRYTWRDIREKIDIFGTEVIQTNEEYYPIKTYLEFETPLAEEDKYVDPHQIVIETLTNISPGEEFWIQMCVRPTDAKEINAWAAKGQQEIAVISGQAKKAAPGVLSGLKDQAMQFPGELLSAAFNGPIEAERKKDEQTLRFFNPVDEARMKGILQKTSHTGFRTKIRIMHIAPAGQLKKPNIARAFGVFKQFNTFHLNGLKPDKATKSNGPNAIMRDKRRYLRERKIFLQFQWRELWYGDGAMYTAEELATIYHFPSKHVKTPGLTRAKSGLQSPPKNLPYA